MAPSEPFWVLWCPLPTATFLLSKERVRSYSPPANTTWGHGEETGCTAASCSNCTVAMNCWWLQLWHQGELKVTPDWCHSPFKFVGFFYLAMLASNALLDLSISTLSYTVHGKSQLQSSRGRSWLTFQSKDLGSMTFCRISSISGQEIFYFCCVLCCRGYGYGGWG